MAKISFKDKTDKEKFLIAGFFLDKFYIPVEEFLEIRQPIRCFNCNSYDHMAKNCTKDICCPKCAENTL